MPAILKASILFLAILLIYWIATYNKLISLKNKTKQTFSGIDIQLKKRWDLIPQLVATVKGYAKHESDILLSITNARQAAQNAPSQSPERFQNEERISLQTPQIIAISEQYPDLKANKQFLNLQRNLTEIEAQIAASRRSYNAATLQRNNLIETFPSNIIASIHKQKTADFFSTNKSERNNVTL